MALWTSNNPEALKLFQRILPAGLLSFLESNECVPETSYEDLGEGVPNRDNLKVTVIHLRTILDQIYLSLNIYLSHTDC